MAAVLPTRLLRAPLLRPILLGAPLLGAAALVAVLGLTACSSPQPAPAAPAPAAAAPGAAAPEGHAGHGGGGAPVGLYAVQSGPLGVVATDAEGHLLYRFDGDTADPSASTCTGPCTDTWIPIIVPAGTEPELLGVDPALVGRLQREGGEQLTLAGWPLYRHRDDNGGLLTAGVHGADGAWFAVTPTGEKAVAP